MKKITIALFMALFAAPLFSSGLNGIEKGDSHVFVIGGAGYPLSPYDGFKYDGDIDKYAKEGTTFGAQYVYYINPYVGFGVEGSFTKYKGHPYFLYDTYGTDRYYQEGESGGERYNFMAVLKLNINPADRIRLYPAIALGANYFKNEDTYHLSVYDSGYSLLYEEQGKDVYKSFMPAGYAGLGIEADVTSLLTIGVEGRYNMYFFNKKKYDSDNAFLTEGSVLFKIGFKF